MRKRSAGIIINENKILLVHRHKNGKEYFVLPGGGVDEGESTEEAVIREIKEETLLETLVEKSLPSFMDEFGDEHFNFVCKYLGGEPRFAEDSPEVLRNNKDNDYKLEWIPLERVKDLKIFPFKTKDQIIELVG